MKPIIKWSGGKSQEIKFFEHKIPKKFNRYIEPFMGGGGVFFHLEHSNSIINDINFELVSLYNLIHNKQKRIFFIKQLNEINKQRILFNEYYKKFNKEEIISLFNLKITKELIIKLPKPILYDLDNKLEGYVKKSLKDKINRIQKIEEKENKKFNDIEYGEHLTTALQSALYFYCRDIYNKGYEELKDKDISHYIANWYYVREFCYSSMFRFSKNGNFNVPYGGIGYNSKDFSVKINNINNNKKLHSLLENTQINKMDFEELFEKYNYFESEDFLFLDPPYDSEFSQYNKEGDFDKKEQIRLRDCLLKVNCKLMVVIKETDFIYDLYKTDFKIEKFDKKYMTNMRNRNNKDVQHLIITNY